MNTNEGPGAGAGAGAGAATGAGAGEGASVAVGAGAGAENCVGAGRPSAPRDAGADGAGPAGLSDRPLLNERPPGARVGPSGPPPSGRLGSRPLPERGARPLPGRIGASPPPPGGRIGASPPPPGGGIGIPSIAHAVGKRRGSRVGGGGGGRRTCGRDVGPAVLTSRGREIEREQRRRHDAAARACFAASPRGPQVQEAGQHGREAEPSSPRPSWRPVARRVLAHPEHREAEK